MDLLDLLPLHRYQLVQLRELPADKLPSLYCTLLLCEILDTTGIVKLYLLWNIIQRIKLSDISYIIIYFDILE